MFIANVLLPSPGPAAMIVKSGAENPEVTESNFVNPDLIPIISLPSFFKTSSIVSKTVSLNVTTFLK